MLNLEEIIDPVKRAIMYTDGSCNTSVLTGAWVAILFIGKDKKQLSGLEMNTTHQRMELVAVIRGVEFLRDYYKDITHITMYTDSQYVAGLQSRKERLISKHFASKKGRPLNNTDLVQQLLKLYELYPIEIIKLKAHQKKDGINDFNIEADNLSRQLVRDALKASVSGPPQS